MSNVRLLMMSPDEDGEGSKQNELCHEGNHHYFVLTSLTEKGKQLLLTGEGY